jgi:hypothetical protein
MHHGESARAFEVGADGPLCRAVLCLDFGGVIVQEPWLANSTANVGSC